LSWYCSDQWRTLIHRNRALKGTIRSRRGNEADNWEPNPIERTIPFRGK
jgi:hypothetical protein